MKIRVQLSVDGQPVKQHTLTIEEQRLGELTDEQIEQAIEVKIRDWVDRSIQVEWETVDE